MAVHIQSSLLTNAVWREERECKHHKFEAQVSHYSFFFKRGAGSDSCHRHVRIEKGINGVSVRNEEQLFFL